MKMQRVKIAHEGYAVGQLITGSSRLDMIEEVEIVDIVNTWPPQPLKLDADGKTAVPFTEAIEAEKKRCEDAAKAKAEMIAKIKATLDECDKDKDENKKGLSYCVRSLLLMMTEGQ